ncbi:hypothetical protein ACRRTK_019454 [Alexandromys fortis]
MWGEQSLYTGENVGAQSLYTGENVGAQSLYTGENVGGTVLIHWVYVAIILLITPLETRTRLDPFMCIMEQKGPFVCSWQRLGESSFPQWHCCSEAVHVPVTPGKLIASPRRTGVEGFVSVLSTLSRRIALFPDLQKKSKHHRKTLGFPPTSSTVTATTASSLPVRDREQYLCCPLIRRSVANHLGKMSSMSFVSLPLLENNVKHSKQASAAKELPKAKNYEVVYPIRLHPLRKRETEEPEPKEAFETELKYQMTINGKVAILYLKKNNKLLAPGYSETYYNSSGKEVTTSPQIMVNCYYQGHIIDEKDSEASISMCDGLRGYFSQGDERYFIEPLRSGSLDEHAHAVFKDDPNEDQANSSCGVDDARWQQGLHGNVVPSATRLIKLDGGKAHEPKTYIEYFLVLDNGEFKKYNKNLTEIRKRVLEMANYVNMLYKKLNAHVALVGMEIWTDEDKIKITPDANSTLDNFSRWRGNDLLKRKHHDIAQLISSRDFSGSTVGLAFMSSMCSPYHSVGVIQDHSNYHLRVAGTMAHEMGHNLGMIHDYLSCKCPSEVCVMEQSLRFHMPTDFSSCSHVNYGQFLEDKLSHCLYNTPLPSDIISIPVCGNQLLEMNEECDCGSPQECTNRCCDAKSCKIKAGFQCALGECCEKCQLKKAGVVCRAAKDECDLPEMCDGKSSHCPVDRFRVNGFPCQNGHGYCLKGNCPTLQQQCTEMWGPGTKVADQSCFQHNEGGSKYGYCHIENGTHVPCKAKNAEQIQNETAMEKAIHRLSKVLHRVCINAECVDMEETYKSTNCSLKCKGHAVCDHEWQCQCKEGWAPPDCEDSATVFRRVSVLSVVDFSIVVGVLFPLAVIFVVVAIVIRHQSARRNQRRVQRSLPTKDAKMHKQKCKSPKAKPVQLQEMSQMKKLHVSEEALPTEENEPPLNVNSRCNSIHIMLTTHDNQNVLASDSLTKLSRATKKQKYLMGSKGNLRGKCVRMIMGRSRDTEKANIPGRLHTTLRKEQQSAFCQQPAVSLMQII